MIPRFNPRILPVLFVSIASLGAVHAEVISLNFVRGSSGASPLAPAAIAGVVAAGNWNNATQANADLATGVPLVNGSGAPTTATADWDSGAASWSVATAGTGTASDMLMMTGYLDQSGDGNGQIHLVTIHNVPFANYDVYLYHSSAGGANRTARYQANGTDLYTRNLDPADTFNGFVNAQYPTLAEATLAGGNPAGNYVRWEGLGGATLSIQGQGIGDAEGGSGGNTRRAPIQGIQIVEVVVTQGLPVVENLPATFLGVNSATANGELLDNGDGADSAAVTIYWGTTNGGTDPLAWTNSVAAATLTAPGTFGSPLTGLTQNTTYYYRSFAKNSAGDDWASISQSFTTLPAPEFPEVETAAATMVGVTTATANGNLVNNGNGADSAALTLYWGPTDGGTNPLAWANSMPAGSLSAPGPFAAALSDLAPFSVYYYRAFARNSVGDDWAPTSQSFATLHAPVAAISLNFVRDTSGETPLAPTAVAGVVQADNWNNAPMANANNNTGFPLVADGGTATGATADWLSGSASWSVGTLGTGSPADKMMMTGYLDQAGDGLNQIHTVTVNNIPYANYNVYLYHSSAGGPNRSARYRANGTDLYTRNLAPADTFNGFVLDQHETLVESNASAGGGNYVFWEGLSGPLSIEAQAIGATDGGYPGSGDTRRAPIQGIQIVASGPPAPFAITNVEYDAANGTVTITWNSEPGANYGIDASESMEPEGQPGGWGEIADSQATETTSTYVHSLPIPAPRMLFLRVRRF